MKARSESRAELHSAWSNAAASQTAPRDLLLVSDFDGTLAEIVADPALSVGRPASMAALRRLVRLVGSVVVLSSRASSELVHLVPISGVHLMGDLGFSLPTAAERRPLDRFNAAAEDRLSAVEGAWLEVKASASAIHLRHADQARERVLQMIEPLVKKEGLEATFGRKVIEVHLPRADKGRSLERLLARLPVKGMVLMGDDENDRSMFQLAARQTMPHFCVGVSSDEVATDLFDLCDITVDGPTGAGEFLDLLVDWAAHHRTGH